MDLDEVKDAVRRWRHDFNRLTFERQRHHEELERLRLHEKLFEDNEKLLRQENAALKSQLSNHCLVLDRLKKLRVQYDALKEDLDDARATMCANVLECDEKMDEKQREWERLVRANAEELSACEAAANQKLESERRAHEERMDEVLKELEAQRAKMKAMEQQHRCELIALQLERDEQLMQMEGKLRKLQSSGHDVCRQKYAALHRELTDLKARMTSNDDDIVGSSPDERGVANGNSTPVVGFQPSSTKQRNDFHRGAANDNHEVHEISEDEGEAEAILPTLEAPSGVGDNAEGVIAAAGAAAAVDGVSSMSKREFFLDLFWRHKHTTVTLCFVFWSFGMCVAFLGPTLLDLGCKTQTVFSTMSWVFFSQSLFILVGAAAGGVLVERYAACIWRFTES
ncbi:M protein, putative [Ixodes scapularis]|uniref:M protein, putative n=1 Tax=Ixodes scapularis TaxID=6945 RepID=B7P7X9_IXOSC|nr:M protein, putative [Ixodes scapularis]|eukprot:XP_002400189.1 M protein, putative [Ixodes scapularis]